MDKLSYRRPHTPHVVIQQVVWLYFRFALSYRDVEDMLAERGIDVSYETVRRWALKFGGIIARKLRQGGLGRTGGGISTKCSSPSTANSCTSGVMIAARNSRAQTRKASTSVSLERVRANERRLSKSRNVCHSMSCLD